MLHGPPKKRPRADDGDVAGAHQIAALASEEGSAFDVEDDDDPGGGNVLARTYDLDPRAHKLDESVKWVKNAKKCSLSLLTGQKALQVSVLRPGEQEMGGCNSPY